MSALAVPLATAGELIVSGITALGTIALAVAAALAYKANRELVRATESQAAALREQSGELQNQAVVLQRQAAELERQAAAMEQAARAGELQATAAQQALERQLRAELIPAGQEHFRIGEVDEARMGPQVIRSQKVWV